MDSELRRACVTALCALARSDDNGDRADAGRGLAGFAEIREAAETLRELVLDSRDTFVTRATTQALLRRRDRESLAIVASALAVADMNHADYVWTAVYDVLGIFSTERDDALRHLAELADSADERVARGARQLGNGLAGIETVLVVAEHAAEGPGAEPR